MASPLSREIFNDDTYSPNPDFGRNAFVAAVRCAGREGMAKRDEAALKLLRWELEGHGKVVMEAMLRHPDKTLAEAVDLIEQEVRSEEHTSELQSLAYLVCRLLLEKKKTHE